MKDVGSQFSDVINKAIIPLAELPDRVKGLLPEARWREMLRPQRVGCAPSLDRTSAIEKVAERISHTVSSTPSKPSLNLTFNFKLAAGATTDPEVEERIKRDAYRSLNELLEQHLR